MTNSDKPQMTDHQTVPHVFTQYNGQQLDLTFSNAEFERRLTRVRELLSTHNLDAFVLTSMHNIKYFSDFVPSHSVAFAVVITARIDNRYPWVDGGMPWRTTYGDNIVYSDWEKKNFFRAIDRVLADHRITPSRLGIEFDGLKVEEYRSFQSWFEDVELVNMAEPIMLQRLLKSDEEVYLIRQGARIADIGGRAIKNAIREGITEYELAFIGTEAIVQRSPKCISKSCARRFVWCSRYQHGRRSQLAHHASAAERRPPVDQLLPDDVGHYTAMERTMTRPGRSATLDLWKINVEAYRLGWSSSAWRDCARRRSEDQPVL